MFQFKQFTIHQDCCAQKVSEVACVQGAWTILPTHCKTMLDIGSGTGLLSLMFAQRYPQLAIDVIEIDEATYKQGEENITSSPFTKNITCLLANINHYKPAKKYDFICCNPPFFEDQLSSPKPLSNIAKHATQLTLHQLLTAIDRLLNEAGSFSILFPYNRLQECVDLCRTFHFYPSKILCIQHSIAHQAKVFVGIFTREEKTCSLEELILKQDGQRSETLKVLMKDFYL